MNNQMNKLNTSVTDVIDANAAADSRLSSELSPERVSPEGPVGNLAVNKELLQYGGQAVIEGVMMRSPRYFSVACRKPDGEIVVQREEVDKSFIGKLKWLNVPFLRGSLALIDAMVLGTRALRFASSLQLAGMENDTVRREGESGLPGGINGKINGTKDEILRSTEAYTESALAPSTVAPSRAAVLKEEEIATAASLVNGPPVMVGSAMPRSGRINDIAIKGTIVVSIVGGLFIFKGLPTLFSWALQHFHVIGQNADGHVLNALDGLVKMVLFFGYIGLISQLKEIKRVFMYHGAEHKAINTLEAGLPLTKENALKASRIHPRCGTSFIFIVLLIDLIVVALLWRPPTLLGRFVLQVSVVPFVAGIAYELIKFAGKFRRNPLVMAAFAPGMATQFLTTREPTPDQIEVALAALYSVLEAEGHLVPQPNLVAEPGNYAPDEPAAATA